MGDESLEAVTMLDWMDVRETSGHLQHYNTNRIS
jgi:hypothetical protein